MIAMDGSPSARKASTHDSTAGAAVPLPVIRSHQERSGCRVPRITAAQLPQPSHGGWEMKLKSVHRKIDVISLLLRS